ncbi:MAG: hypothetical protein EBZ36_06915 [Acidobacteria bacterium]|nr:hypothetical protein [Acidobacteriota bacterium]
MKITPEILEQHRVTSEEYAKIRELLGREPNLTELGIFSVMWSEHCSYKSSKVHLRRLPTEGECLVQGPGENAGIVEIGNGWCAAFKIESHNHPSFIEPYQGAATGIGGILRDIFTMGARPVAAMNSLRFGPIRDSEIDPASEATSARSISRNRRIMAGRVRAATTADRGGRRSAAKSASTGAIRSIRWSTPSLSGWSGVNRSFTAKPKGSAIQSSTLEPRPGGTESMERRWPRPSLTRRRWRNGQRCRWATRSRRNCCSRPASKRCARGLFSAFRIWERPA